MGEVVTLVNLTQRLIICDETTLIWHVKERRQHECKASNSNEKVVSIQIVNLILYHTTLPTLNVLRQSGHGSYWWQRLAQPSRE